MTQLDEWPEYIVAWCYMDEMLQPGYVFEHCTWGLDGYPMIPVPVEKILLARVLWSNGIPEGTLFTEENVWPYLRVGYRCPECCAMYFAADRDDPFLTRHDCRAEQLRRMELC